MNSTAELSTNPITNKRRYMKMAEQNCAHDECDYLVEDGKGNDKEGETFAAIFAQRPVQRAAAKHVNAVTRIARKFAH